MTGRFSSTATMLALAGLSAGSVLLVEEKAASLAVSLAAIGIALVKAVLILNRFMHLRWRHRPFAQVLSVWLVAVAAILGIGLAVLPPASATPAIPAPPSPAQAAHEMTGPDAGTLRRE